MASRSTGGSLRWRWLARNARALSVEALLSRAHTIALVGFAACLALLEGPAEIACAIAVLTTLLTGRLRGWRPSAMALGVIAWAALGVPGALANSVHVSSEDSLRPLLALAFLVGACGFSKCATEMRDANTLRRCGLAFATCCVLNGAYGYLQLAFGRLPLDRFLLANPKSSQIWVPDRIGGVLGVSGLFYNRLKLAHVGILGLALLLLIIVRPRPFKEGSSLAPCTNGHTGWKTAILVLGAAILGGAIVLTFARMALVAFFVAGCVTFIASSRKRALFLPGAAGAFLAASLAFFLASSEFGRERLSRIAGDVVIRRSIFEVACSIFAEHPMIGVGHGVYRVFAATRAGADVSGALRIDAHNLTLHVLAETGVLGAIGFGLTFFGAAVTIFKRVHQNRGSALDAALLDRWVLFGLVAVFVLGFTHYPLHHAPVALAFWFIAGAAFRES